MADRDAKVRLNLAAAGFLSQMRELEKHAKEFGNAIEGIGDDAAKANKKTSGFLSALKTGAGGAKGALGELGGSIKNTLALAASLGGTLSIGAAMHEAQATTSAYKDLAFAIRRGTGEAMTWEQVQADVEAVGHRWKRSNKEIEQSYADIYGATGNLAFSKKAIDSVAAAANASGKSTQTLSNIAGTLNEKFGIGAEGIDNALASVLELGNKGGVSVEDMGEKLGLVGASAKLLGMSGQQGLQQVLGLLNIADDATGSFKKSLAATSTLLEGLADPDKAKAIQKALGVNILDKSGATRGDALERILAKTKGKQSELAKVFSGEELKLIVALSQNFTKTFDATKGDVKTKTAAAIDAFRKSLTDAGQASFTGAQMLDEANKRNNDAQRNMQAAMNDFVKAFERPEMIRAVDQVAAAAPKLAHFLGNLVEFAANHPILAGAGVVGGVAAKGALTATISKFSEGLMEGGGEKLAKAAAAHPNWAAAGKAMGVAAAALIAFEVGKALIDKNMDDDERKRLEGLDAAATADSMAKHGVGTPEQRKAAADRLRAEIARDEKEGVGLTTTLFGSAANFFDPSVEHPETRRQRELAEKRAALKKLEGSMSSVPFGPPPPPAGVAPGGPPSAEAQKLAKEIANGEPKKTVITNENALAAAVARQLGSVTLRVQVAGGGSGTNGLPPPAGNGSGSAI